MSEPPFDQPGPFWKVGLHCHSDASDGALSPAEVCRRYRAAGYDAVAVTDHFRAQYGYPVTDTRSLRTPDFTTLVGAELHAPRTELSEEWHVLAVGLPLDFAPPSPGETGPELARRARAAGAFVGLAHPAASMLTDADAESLDAAHAVEVHNALAVREDRGDSWPACDLLLARGRRLTAYAADDAHFQPHDPPGCTSWVQVRASRLDPDELLAALLAGRYYASTGPEVHDVAVEGDHVRVSCSPVVRVLLTGASPAAEHVEGEALTEARVPLGRFAGSPFVRLTLVAADGSRAWTNPVWRG